MQLKNSKSSPPITAKAGEKIRAGSFKHQNPQNNKCFLDWENECQHTLKPCSSLFAHSTVITIQITDFFFFFSDTLAFNSCNDICNWSLLLPNGKAKSLVQSFPLSIYLSSGLFRLLVEGSVWLSLYLNLRDWYDQSWIKDWSNIF